jgi:hypothetical protein
MMAGKYKRFTLKKETLRSLNRPEMDRRAGGNPQQVSTTTHLTDRFAAPYGGLNKAKVHP